MKLWGSKNPLEYLEIVHGIPPDHPGIKHITFDPQHVGDYKIIRGHSYDGTLALHYNLINRVLEPVIQKSSYYTLNPVPDDKWDSVRYIIGEIAVNPVDKDPPTDKPWLQSHERASMAVTCLWS